jgi:hypothetical protein
VVSHHVFRPTRVLTTHGSFTPSHVPPLCPALPFQISYQDVFESRSIPLHGIRATDLPQFFKWIKQHLRIKRFYGTTENAVKTQIWIAISIYVLVAIVKKRLKIESSLYTILQILSLTLFEKTTLDQLLNNMELQMQEPENYNQLNLFD